MHRSDMYQPARTQVSANWHDAGMPPMERDGNPRHVPQVHDRQPSGRQRRLMRVAELLLVANLRAL